MKHATSKSRHIGRLVAPLAGLLLLGAGLSAQADTNVRLPSAQAHTLSGAHAKRVDYRHHRRRGHSQHRHYRHHIRDRHFGHRGGYRHHNRYRYRYGYNGRRQHYRNYSHHSRRYAEHRRDHHRGFFGLW